MTIREAAAQSSAVLNAAGIGTPALDAALLLAHVLGISRTALIAAGTEPLSQEALTLFHGLIDRRLRGECVAYITGKKEFRGLEFEVTSSVLVPRPDTEILVEAAIQFCGNDSGKNAKLCVLDLCTGSGAAAIALKNEIPGLSVFAADISADALAVAKRNAAKLLGADVVIEFFCGDLFDALPSPCLFDLITGNPPYIPSNEMPALPAEVQKEPRLALDGGGDGLEIISRIIEEAPRHLRSGGALLLEADPRQMKDIAVLLEKRGFSGIQIYNDLSGFERVIGGVYD